MMTIDIIILPTVVYKGVSDMAVGQSRTKIILCCLRQAHKCAQMVCLPLSTLIYTTAFLYLVS